MSWAKVKGRHSFVGRDVRLVMGLDTRGKRTMQVSIGCDVWQKLGWNDGVRVDLYWGEGKDLGWFKLEAGAHGRFGLRKKGRGPNACLRISFKHMPAHLAAGPIATTIAKHLLPPGGELYVELPEAFRASPLNLPGNVTQLRKASG